MKHLHITALFLSILIISLPVCFADELRLQYDPNGNVVYDGQYYREYNGLNQLYRIRNGSNTSSPIYQEYTYHPLEERVIEKKTFNSNGTLKERVIYWDPDYVTIINSSGTYNYEYIHAEGQLMAQINPDGSIYYMETDIKGDVVAVMNSTGAVIENTSYSPYGEVLTGGKATRFGYEAQEHDSVLGDTDFHARKYKAEWGIFLQPDTIIPNGYDPQKLNRYMFERGNPYNNFDPSGHDATVTFNDEDDTITITAEIIIYGDQASEEVATRMQTDINDAWNNGNPTYKGGDTTYSVKFDIKVTYSEEQPSSLRQGQNRVEVTNDQTKLSGGTSSFVNIAKGNEGTWRGNDPDPAPHEMGHLLGVRDTYDYKTQKALVGWEGNIMAEPAMRGTTDSRNIKSIVDRAYSKKTGFFNKIVNFFVPQKTYKYQLKPRGKGDQK